MKNWELCPKCNGQGTCYSAFSNSTSAICDVCLGKKIINLFSGLPPNGSIVSDFGNIQPPDKPANDNIGYSTNGELVYV